MATPQHKPFCILQLSKKEFVSAVQRAFRRRFGIDPPRPKEHRRWYRQFEETGCVCKGKRTGRPRTSEENLRRIQESFARSPCKYIRASRDLAISHNIVWPVLKWKGRRVEFCDAMLRNMEDDRFLPHLIFSDEATFHLSGKVYRHNVRIWRTQNPRKTVEHEPDSPKVNVFCAISQRKGYGPYFFKRETVAGRLYLKMLREWLFPQLKADYDDFYQQVRDFLNAPLPQNWIGRMGP
ncbi:hypothetical protein B7P43_G02454 [Cryptotermes secundus]|uniref:Uncharacterized protein n=1 Tax=Cryptotermes secundus TaxID=105785 RepID=A0A2J7QVD5_9NEOP|nr:hypothetical protein B7P43_G02454 [Cryptotermes secundus]